MRRSSVTEKYNEEYLFRLKRESSLLIKNSSDLVSILAKIFNCMTGVSAFLQQLKTFSLSPFFRYGVPCSSVTGFECRSSARCTSRGTCSQCTSWPSGTTEQICGPAASAESPSTEKWDCIWHYDANECTETALLWWALLRWALLKWALLRWALIRWEDLIHYFTELSRKDSGTFSSFF